MKPNPAGEWRTIAHRELTLIDPAHGDDDWRDRANCLGLDPNDMQPEVATAADVELAKAVCGGCSVRFECRQWAESQEAPYGVHAGEWFGPPPRDVRPRCAWCERPMASAAEHGRPREFCGATCRVRAHRARQAVSA